MCTRGVDDKKICEDLFSIKRGTDLDVETTYDFVIDHDKKSKL